MENTLVSDSVLRDRLAAEGITEGFTVCAARWAESAPLQPGVKSALATCDAVIRSDGSAVFIDGMMSMDGRAKARGHMGVPDYADLLRTLFPEVPAEVDPENVARVAREMVGWDTYVVRMQKS